jgi:A/G-specific adenine glycosylase
MHRSDKEFPPPFSKVESARLARKLIAWFRRSRRDLPWRLDRDPYKIWVSEVMLQQTTVNQVVPYFARFLDAFPNLQQLANADEQSVLRHWEGLGYYRRARDLHRAAKIVASEHNGVIPTDPQLLGQLPGMGRYTCNAVLSQAFDVRLPIIETNSQRVLCRLFGQAQSPADSRIKKWLWAIAEHLLPKEHAGDFNQALMELGALVCKPSKPGCSACPVANQCSAFRAGLQDQIPAAPRPPRIVEVQEVAGVVYKGYRVLLVQRSAKGRWANMWEFPHGPVEIKDADDKSLVGLLADKCGLKGKVGQEIMILKHAVTRYRISMSCFEVKWLAGRFRSNYYQASQWLLPKEVANFPVSVPQRQLAKFLLAPSRQRSLF